MRKLATPISIKFTDDDHDGVVMMIIVMMVMTMIMSSMDRTEAD